MSNLFPNLGLYETSYSHNTLQLVRVGETPSLCGGRVTSASGLAKVDEGISFPPGAVPHHSPGDELVTRSVTVVRIPDPIIVQRKRAKQASFPLNLCIL